MGVHDTLLHDLRLIWEGKPDEVSNTWRNNRSPNHNYAKLGGSGSRNIPWMANAIGIYFEDAPSAQWVFEATKRELTYATTDTHVYRYDCWELNSLNYDAWSWVAEMSAMTFLRKWKSKPCLGPGDHELLEAADAWVTRFLAHRAIFWAMQSRPRIQAHRDNGKLYWQGMGGYPGGLRSHPMQIWQANQCGVDAVGLEPELDGINPDADLPFIIHAASDWGLGQEISVACQKLARSDYSPSTQAACFPYLIATRTGIPWNIKRWGTTIFSAATSHIQGGNTGAVWGTLLTGDDNWVTAYPYSSDRIRSGHPELGRGEAHLEDDFYECHNLTLPEAEKPNKGPRIRDGFDCDLGEPDLELRCHVDAENELYLNGTRWTG